MTCVNSQLGTAVALVDRGAIVNMKNLYENTPLHMACVNGHVRMAIIYIYRSIHLSIYLVGRGSIVNEIDDNGETPLHMACEEGYSGTAIALLDRSANVDMKNICGDTPLHWACLNGHLETRLLS